MASRENKDEETRDEAKAIMNDICFNSQPRAGRAGSAETAKPKSPTGGMQPATVRTMCVELGH